MALKAIQIQTLVDLAENLALFTEKHFSGKKIFARFAGTEKQSKKKTFLDQLIDTRGWFVTKDKWDAIVFEPKRNVLIYGIGIYQQIDRERSSFTLSYKILIEDKDGKTVNKFETTDKGIRQPDDTQIIQDFFIYEFPKYKGAGIPVKAGQKFNYAQWAKFKEGKPRTYNARNDNRPVQSNDDFKIMKSKLDSNGTCVESGIIPAILYAYAD
ncbi:hypothetical protein FGO68_gene14978 [Halteria grandinella]|uniref:PHR domain-containing protein n=1 Tax=Halteria grandinella TaxID=5974 RepID=A0A8J8NYC1_HALGN|nr:hypothetical protein FGO68_gene14978 [Halteria grandinella]